MRILLPAILTFLVFTNNFISAQTTTVNPDFEAELINLGIDTNGVTGDILNTDAQAVTNLNLSGTSNITDITGINAFVNVTDLNLGNNLIANIAPTSLSALVNFRSDNNSALTTIDLTQNTLLETFFVHGDFPAVPPITQIDLSQNTNLFSINGDFLDKVTDFIFPITPTLTQVSLRYLSDETIDVSGLTNLEHFSIGGWRSNVNVTLPNTSTLRNLRITSIEIETIDLSVFTNLETLYLWGTYVQNLILPNSLEMRDIFIILHDIQNPLNFSVMPNLTDIDITSNKDTPLVVDVTQNLKLKDLDLSRNDMNAIDITQNVLLETVRMNVNNLISIDVTQNVELSRFEAYSNKITAVDLTNNIDLEYLRLYNNLIPNLDVTKNVKLRSININTNLFTTTGLDLTQNTELSSLDISHNQIESLDISKNVGLYNFNLSHNIFPGTDILDQYATIITNRGILSGQLIANNNLLEGPIPDFYALYDPTLQTRRFELFINENKFHFGDFESQHLGLVDLTTTMSIGPSPDLVIKKYHYAPQEKVNAIENLTINAGDNVTLTTTVRGTQNHYTWFKDGVIISDAPDAPEYTITNVNSCDAAVYHSEIRSDLVPFENTNPAGTNGKNLLLVRNDINVSVTSPTESCVTLTAPLNNSVNIPINQSLEWTDHLGACGYFLSIGTTSGGTDILNNVDVENVNTYNIGSNFPPNTELFVTLTPYFSTGVTLNCSEESFTTNNAESPTVCTNLTAQYSGQELPTSTNIEWLPADFATGYFVTIGSSTNGNDIYNMFDNGNSTIFNPPVDFDSGETFYVTITPYNSLGKANSCTKESFTTRTNQTIPECTTISSPQDGDTNVNTFDTLFWNTVPNADGYLITITSPSGTNNVTNLDRSGSSWDFGTEFEKGDVVTVTIVPYNAAGQAVGCTSETFTLIKERPICTSLSTPSNGDTDVALDTDISWDSVPDADGYILTIGTTSGGTDILNALDVFNVTTFNLPNDLPEGTSVFVTITPYNSAGNAMGCSEESFTTEKLRIDFEVDNTKYGFSPNGDGINDFWKIDTIENYPNNTVTIYNRWGDIVFTIKGYNNTINVFRGEANRKTKMGANKLPSGTYFFDIKISGNHNLKKTKGFVVLKR